MLLDASGCSSVEVSLFDYLSGRFANVSVSGTVNVTNAPFGNVFVYQLSKAIDSGFTCSLCSSDLKAFVSLTELVNLTQFQMQGTSQNRNLTL